MDKGQRLEELTAVAAARLIHARELSPLELVSSLLERAASLEPLLRAWQVIDWDGAMRAARVAEQQVMEQQADRLGALHGVPYGVKDVIDTSGCPTMAGFAPFRNRVPDQDAEVIARLRAAGAILLGKTVTTQWAFADPAETRNPWSPDRTPGGSSSGSGVAVAAREIPFALGTQTGGSLLRPAAYTGVIGFKPTYGRISNRGVLPLAWTLDTVGVITRSVEDCLLFVDIAGQPNEPDLSWKATEARRPRPAKGGFRLGLVTSALVASVPTVRTHLQDLAKRLEANGTVIEEADFGGPLDLILAVQSLITQCEATAAQVPLIRSHAKDYAPRLRAFIEVGEFIPAHVYLHAQRLRGRLKRGLLHSLANVDALLLPTVGDVAPSMDGTGDPTFQHPFTLAGVPAITLPSGLSPEGLPMAIQLVGKPWEDRRLLEVASWVWAILGPCPVPPMSSAAQS